MKICIITYTRTKNYGGVIQAFGLYKYLTDIGHDVAFVDYIPERSNINDKDIYARNLTQRSKLWGKSKLTRKIWELLFYKKFKNDYIPFSNFIEQNTKLTRPYFTNEDFKKNPPEADIFISGSDQIWNSNFSLGKKIDLPYYLDFVPDGVRKISYASSFGTDALPDGHYKTVAALLSRYEILSVREKNGINLLKKMGLNGTRVLDPTMLCKREIWEHMALNRIINRPYLFVYQIKNTHKIINMAKKTAKKLGLKLVIATMNRMDAIKMNCKVVLAPEVKDWLSFIRFANVVITESFHATIFSILFHRNFIVNSFLHKDSANRIHTLLNMLELSNRELNSFFSSDAYELLSKEIDYRSVDEKLNFERQKSIEWLSAALSGNSKKIFQV